MLPDLSSLRIAASDLNGRMRGKRLPADFMRKVENGAVRMPLSVLNVDIWGADIDNNPLVFETGDRDGYMQPTGRGAVPMPWLSDDAYLMPATMLKEDQTPFEGDPRRALERVLERYTAKGWEVRAAAEMEFYLVDDSGETPVQVKNPRTGRALVGANILSLAELDAFEPFFNSLYRACDMMDIPAQTAISEVGTGQFEIDINHREAMEAADNAWLFKTMVKGIARQHNMAATFMPKPFAGDAGTGLHVHFRLWMLTAITSLMTAQRKEMIPCAMRLQAALRPCAPRHSCLRLTAQAMTGSYRANTLQFRFVGAMKTALPQSVSPQARPLGGASSTVSLAETPTSTFTSPLCLGPP